jgi:hypothetical protein
MGVVICVNQERDWRRANSDERSGRANSNIGLFAENSVSVSEVVAVRITKQTFQSKPSYGWGLSLLTHSI